MSSSEADMHVQTRGLREFAEDQNVDLDVDSISGVAQAAGQGRSLMEEGAAFHEAHRASIAQVTEHLGVIKRGNQVYRTGANQMAGLHVDTEDAARQTILSVPRFGPDSGAESSTPPSPTMQA